VLADGAALKRADGTVIDGTEVADAVVQGVAGQSGAKTAAALASMCNSLLKSYGSVLAIAVRSREIGETRVSIAAAVVVSKIELNKSTWTCQVAKQSAFEFHNSTESPERVAWWTYIAASRESLPLPMLLIVEGGIETLAAINARSETLVDAYLPEGYTLAWGRATDTATDFISGQALRSSVEDATRLLDWISANPECLKRVHPGSSHYSHMRVWQRTVPPEEPSGAL
jgi:hypothetical protein